jgi:hypothetical protein
LGLRKRKKLKFERNGSGTEKKWRRVDIHMTFTIKNCRVVVVLFRNNNNKREFKKYTHTSQGDRERVCEGGSYIKSTQKNGLSSSSSPTPSYSNGEFKVCKNLLLIGTRIIVYIFFCFFLFSNFFFDSRDGTIREEGKKIQKNGAIPDFNSPPHDTPTHSHTHPERLK